MLVDMSETCCVSATDLIYLGLLWFHSFMFRVDTTESTDKNVN